MTGSCPVSPSTCGAPLSPALPALLVYYAYVYFSIFLSSYSKSTHLTSINIITLFLQNNVSHLRIFVIYYWIDLAFNFFFSVVFAVVAFSVGKSVCDEIVNDESADTLEKIDMQSCLSIYLATCTGVVLAMGFSLLLKVPFSFPSPFHCTFGKLSRFSQGPTSISA